MTVKATFGLFETRCGHLAAVYRYDPYNHRYFKWIGIIFPCGPSPYSERDWWTDDVFCTFDWTDHGFYTLDERGSLFDLVKTLHTFKRGDLTKKDLIRIKESVGSSGMAEPLILATIKRNQDRKRKDSGQQE